MAGGFGGGGSQSNQGSGPWEGQAPYLTDVFDKAQNWYKHANLNTPSEAWKIKDKMYDRANENRFGTDLENQAGNFISENMGGNQYSQDNPFTGGGETWDPGGAQPNFSTGPAAGMATGAEGGFQGWGNEVDRHRATAGQDRQAAAVNPMYEGNPYQANVAQQGQAYQSQFNNEQTPYQSSWNYEDGQQGRQATSQGQFGAQAGYGGLNAENAAGAWKTGRETGNENTWMSRNPAHDNQFTNQLAAFRSAQNPIQAQVERANRFTNRLGNYDAQAARVEGGREQGTANPYAEQASQNPYLGQAQQYQNQHYQQTQELGNEHLDSMVNRAQGRLGENFNNQVLPGLNATFGGAGRTGSMAHAQHAGLAAGELGDAMAGVATDMYGGAYENQMNRQLQRDMAEASGLEGHFQRDLQRRQSAEQNRLQGLGMGADSYEGAMGRNLTRDTMNAQFEDAANARDLQARMKAGDLEAGTLSNVLSRDIQGSNVFESGQDRNLRALLGADASRSAAAQRQLSERQTGAEMFDRSLSRNMNREFKEADMLDSLLGRNLQKDLKGADLYNNLQNRNLSREQGQNQIDSSMYDSMQNRNLQRDVTGQTLNQDSFENMMQRNMQERMQGQDINADAFQQMMQRNYGREGQFNQLNADNFNQMMGRQMNRDLQAQNLNADAFQQMMGRNFGREQGQADMFNSMQNRDLQRQLGNQNNQRMYDQFNSQIGSDNFNQMQGRNLEQNLADMASWNQGQDRQAGMDQNMIDNVQGVTDRERTRESDFGAMGDEFFNNIAKYAGIINQNPLTSSWGGSSAANMNVGGKG